MSKKWKEWLLPESPGRSIVGPMIGNPPRIVTKWVVKNEKRLPYSASSYWTNSTGLKPWK